MRCLPSDQNLIHERELKKCRVCGHEYENFFPWGEDGKAASFEICDCCGTQFGYEDVTTTSIMQRRNALLSEKVLPFKPKK